MENTSPYSLPSCCVLAPSVDPARKPPSDLPCLPSEHSIDWPGICRDVGVLRKNRGGRSRLNMTHKRSGFCGFQERERGPGLGLGLGSETGAREKHARSLIAQFKSKSLAECRRSRDETLLHQRSQI
ncbi:hypothetical protein WMY93_002906 [Mugilogobius chulae]|uniref:Uncharacterized protein n=1 Tax=Mugilogobius chulae TaxID=88201 RepID=A0AAW0PVY4_9GOBI